MRRLFSVSFLFLMLLSFGCFLMGCDRAHAGYPTDLFSKALDAELTVKRKEITYRITVHLDAVSEGSDGSVRKKEVIFLSPESIAGTAVIENEDGRFLKRGEATALTEHAEGLLLGAALLSPGEVLRTEHVIESGCSYTVFYFSDGRTVYADADTGALRRITAQDCTATVEWIESRKTEE